MAYLSKPNRFYYPAKIFLTGLAVSQIIATLHVYMADVTLYNSVSLINEAGYLAIPNQLVMRTLNDFKPAFCGGLFFTLTIGAGLTVISFFCIWMWRRLFSENNYILFIFILLWLCCIGGLNYKYFNPVVTLYFIVIPLTVAIATLKIMPEQNGKTWGRWILQCAPLMLLLCLWTSQIDRHLFIDFRDNILLTNSFGIGINDFYYRYTLYPADIIKSLDQKVIRTCDIENIGNNSLKKRLEDKLRQHDYLTLNHTDRTDLKIKQEGDFLEFISGNDVMLKVSIHAFFSNPHEILKEFSSKTDPNKFFKKSVFLSLIIGLPITLYVLIFALCYGICACLFDISVSLIPTSILCFIIGASILVPFCLSRSESINVKDLPVAMNSDSSLKRLSALKALRIKKIDIGKYRPYDKIRHSSNIAERYWLAVLLADCNDDTSYNELLSLLNDPHPNVVCMALKSLGKRRKRECIETILNKIKLSDHWYEQWYGYKALRELGWIQTKSR